MPPQTRSASAVMRLGVVGLVLGGLAVVAAYVGIAQCLSGMRCVADPTALFAALFAGIGAIAVSAALCLLALWLRARARRRFLHTPDGT